MNNELMDKNMEIEFRFWVTSIDRMVYWETAIKECDRLSLLSLRGYTPMQYIGKKDKNGKKIYKGDILATLNDNPKYDKWSKEDNGYTTVIWDEENDCWCGSMWTWERGDESVYSLMFIEVIGNIYETPKLA